jgi:hypothetical protein
VDTRASTRLGQLHLVADAAQISINGLALWKTRKEYFEFSPRAMKLLQERGAIPTTDGFFRSFVRDRGQFAGNLDWKSVSLSPEQALSIQAAAGQMALRAAIKDVVAAIERLEGKVDTLIKLANADRLGRVIADRQTLMPLVTRARSTGTVTKTDWSTVDTLGADIARDIESLRAYVQSEIAEVAHGRSVHRRIEETDDLKDRMLRESIALLVVAEANYSLWQEIRLCHARSHEPEHADAIRADIITRLNELTAADQSLADELSKVVQALAEPTGYEGLAILRKQKLIDNVLAVSEMTTWFVQQRHLDPPSAVEVEYADFSDSFRKAAGRTKEELSSSKDAIASGARWAIDAARRRGKPDGEGPTTPPELTP